MNRNYLSIENTISLKGIAAIMVLMHHLFQCGGLSSIPFIGTIFQELGYWTVALFFFLSGYGLIESYKTKGMQYIREFPRKRIFSFYCMCLFFAIVYFLRNICVGESLSDTNIITLVINFGNIIQNGWYLQVILLFYIIFYFIFRSKLDNKIKINIFFIATVIYVIYSAINLNLTWYQGVFSMVLGMYWSFMKEKIDFFIKDGKKYFLSIVILAIFFVLSFLTAKMIRGFVGKFITIFTSAAFVCIVVLLLKKVKITNIVTHYLGIISLEIYLLQGLFLTGFHSDMINIENPLIYSVLVTIATILLSVVVHPIIKFIMKFTGGQKYVKIKINDNSGNKT